MEPTHLPQFTDVPWRWICYATSAFLLVAILFGFFHEIELKQDVQGEIVSPSDVKIRGLSGFVARIYVQPLAHVEPGTPLFQLDRDLSLSSDGRQRLVFDEQMRDEQLRASEAQYEQRRHALNAQREAARLTQLTRQAEMSALDQQIVQNRQLVSDAEKKLARLRSVAEYVTADRIEQASAETHQGKVAVAQSQAQRQQLIGALASGRSAQTDLEAQLRELDAQHQRERQDIHMRYEQVRQDATISAPKAGVVTFSNLVPGRSLSPDDIALVISTDDHGPLRAALRIPSRQRGFVQEGQIVRLKLDAFPYARFGTYEARIDSISSTTVQSQAPSPGASGPKGTIDGDYIAWATLRGNTFDSEGKHFRILPGMSATGSIVIERRTIAEWVLAPLFRVIRG